MVSDSVAFRPAARQEMLLTSQHPGNKKMEKKMYLSSSVIKYSVVPELQAEAVHGHLGQTVSE